MRWTGVEACLHARVRHTGRNEAPHSRRVSLAASRALHFKNVVETDTIFKLGSV